jgi:hypothetical protein
MTKLAASIVKAIQELKANNGSRFQRSPKREPDRAHL